MSDLKQAIQREYLQCASNPVHFMRKYCTIQHPTKGKVKFDLYPFQENCLTEFKDNRYNIILKARQLGISTLSAGYALWLMLFHNDKNILVIATGKDTAKNLVTKVRVMYDGLPHWLKTAIVEVNNDTIIKSVFCPIIKPIKIAIDVIAINPICTSNNIVRVIAPTVTGIKYSDHSNLITKI